MEHSCVLVIPALNPPYSFVEYAASLKEAGFSRILVINDGSTKDNTAEVAADYEKRYPNIVRRFISSPFSKALCIRHF